MTILKFYLLFIFIHLATLIFAQSPTAIHDEYIVQFYAHTNPHTSLKKINTNAQNKFICTLEQQLVPNINIWLLKTHQARINNTEVLEFLQKQLDIELVQKNHLIELRNTIPNDQLFSNQWEHINNGASGGVVDMDLDSDQAWDISTGGLTSLGDTIVVAVLDNGANYLHNDLAANIWYNRAEIPSNNLDDDGNGYIDDYKGWNIIQHSDDIFNGAGGTHGTPVAGIIGAVGNNNIGVAGINWNIKLMIIRNNFSATEANAIAAYGYALTQRKIYNTSQGTRGALVVATNASWGIDYGKASDAPIWCAFYDTLGKYGILNVAATANLEIDVDIEGDLPTTCPSQALISVTNMDRAGQKVQYAAYGATSIDLGAFGEQTYTISNNSGYGIFGGTSAASPHATGVVALTYSALCPQWIHLARANPEQVTIAMRNFILNGTIPNIDLQNITTTNGVLNAYNSLLLAQNNCPTNLCIPPYYLRTLSIDSNFVEIGFSHDPNIDSFYYQYRIANSMWSTIFLVQEDSFAINNMIPCLDYEIRLWSKCNSSNSDTVSYFIKTRGCCEIPNGLNVHSIQDSSAVLSYNLMDLGLYYIVQHREQNTSTWQQDTVLEDSLMLDNLSPCSYYEIRVQAYCSNGVLTNFSDTVFFATMGCQDCSFINYCTMLSTNSNQDFIYSVSLNGDSIVTGNNGGYVLIDTANWALMAGQTYNLEIKQGLLDYEYIRVWGDWNGDGDFDDANELVFENTLAFASSLNQSFNVPSFANYGASRLRIAMRYGLYPSNCNTYPYGDVEDYCIFINPYSSLEKAETLKLFSIWLNTSNDRLYVKNLDTNFSTYQCLLYSMDGRLLWESSFQATKGEISEILLPNYLASGVYFIQVGNGQERGVVKFVKS